MNSLMPIVIKLRQSNYTCEVTFLADLIAAKAGNRTAQHQIWVKMMSKVKGVGDDLGLAYCSYCKSLLDYDISKPLREGKQHRWQFAAFCSQRLRAAKQEERNLMEHPVRVNQRARYYGKEHMPVSGYVDPDQITQNESGRWVAPLDIC